MSTEISQHTDFLQIRYAQCWEDADILLLALRITEKDTCLSIASAGDNALAMLAQGSSKVIALDLNPTQLACLELRVAGYQCLTHQELLGLIGDNNLFDRYDLYRRCRDFLSDKARLFWDNHIDAIRLGIGNAGKFENYFKVFRERILPLIHSKSRIQQLLNRKTLSERTTFYNKTWNNWRWQLLFRLFFSRFVMGRLGRDPSFFQYVSGNVSQRILDRTLHALTELDPIDNPYLQWILLGKHQNALPYALREENFEAIRNNLSKLEIHQSSVEEYLRLNPQQNISCFNLSDIFEYMSESNYRKLLKTLLSHATPGARLVYWNMLVPRSRPEELKESLLSNEDLAKELFQQDKAFFYSRFVIEEFIG